MLTWISLFVCRSFRYSRCVFLLLFVITATFFGILTVLRWYHSVNRAKLSLMALDISSSPSDLTFSGVSNGFDALFSAIAGKV
jgi:hypothetical protein